MKKTYDKPEIETLDLRGCTELLFGSDEDYDSPGNSGFGHRNACSHGAHNPFCE